MKTRSTYRTWLVAVCTCFIGMGWGGTALAEPVWICALINAVACNDRGEIGEPDLGRMSRPTFLRVDSAKKLVTILAPNDRRGETSVVDTLVKHEVGWLLTGTEDGKAWTMMINEEEGHMTLSITGDGEVWSVFGHIIPEDALSTDPEKGKK